MFLGIVVISAAFEPALLGYRLTVSDGTRALFYIMNLGASTLIVFAASAWFVHTIQQARADAQHKSEELQAALTELRETQARLIHAEKMASLGQLTAGIAHEIKNPLNFVRASTLIVFAASAWFVHTIQQARADAQHKSEELQAALTELRETQARLIHAEKMASLGQLTAGIAHEIKNPLNFVNNFSALSVELVEEIEEACAANKGLSFTDLREEFDALKYNARQIDAAGPLYTMEYRQHGSVRSGHCLVFFGAPWRPVFSVPSTGSRLDGDVPRHRRDLGSF